MSDDEQIPTATLDKRVEDFLYPKTKQVKLIFLDPQGRKVAFITSLELLAGIERTASKLIAQFHQTMPKDEGKFFHGSIVQPGVAETLEASVSGFNDLRGRVGIQFEGSIVYILPNETALSLAELIVDCVERMETPEERTERLKRKRPTILQPRAPRIITS